VKSWRQKRLSRKSPGKSGLLEDFWEIYGAKGVQNSRFGMILGVIFGHFGGYGEIVKIELSLERELNPEGRREVRNDINFHIFSRAALEPTFRGRMAVFLPVLGTKVVQSGVQWAPRSIKNRLKMVSGIGLVSHWLPDPPQGGPGTPKRYQK